MKNQSGVSLITLVITIIVVIILAAIALGGGALDTAGQAQFSGFATEMGALQDTMKQAQITIRGEEQIRGHAVTEAQVYNYLARGADESGDIQPDESGDKKWLSRSQANSIPCTPINRAYGTKMLDMKVRKVETDQGSNQIVSYFVTPTGNVFCWPPYIYDGKSYVTNVITAKTADGAEYDGTTATATTASPVITFENGEKILISNTDVALDPANVGTSAVTFDASKVSVVYKARTTDTETGGTSYGFTFTGYDNTL